MLKFLKQLYCSHHWEVMKAEESYTFSEAVDKFSGISCSSRTEQISVCSICGKEKVEQVIIWPRS